MSGKFNLRQRMVLFSLVIMIIGLGIFSWLAVQSVNDSTQRTLDERLIIARLAASRLDETLRNIVVQIQASATSYGSIKNARDFLSVADPLLSTLTKSGISVQNILIVDASGKVLFVEPGILVPADTMMSGYPSVNKALNAGVPTISGLVSLPFVKTPEVLINVPMPSTDGQIPGVLVCLLDLDQSIQGQFSQALIIGKTGYTEIVDESGVVIARTSPGLPLQTFEMSDHPGRFADLIAQDKATVRTCHRCHESDGNVVRKKDVLAFAPLTQASWGVAVRQPEEEALSPTWELEKKLAFFGIILVGCTALLVVLMLRGIIGPIRLLTSAARKIADGDLETSIPVGRKDEIGELSTAFQSMRSEIAKSRKEMDTRYLAAQETGEMRGGLLNSVIRTQEEERQRIARDLHDVSIQSLILVCRQLDGLQDIKSTAGISSARETLEETMTGLRSIIKDLRPPVLDDLGLIASMRRILRDFEARSGIKVKFVLSGEDRRLSPEIELGIFRVANEALWNVEHHAKADRVTMSFTFSEEGIQLEVQDNGVGFEVPSSLNELSGRGKFGLLGMRERVELLGGSLEVSSSPGKGTRITVKVQFAPELETG